LSEGHRTRDWKLKFLYLGSANIDKDLKYYRDTLGAKLVWHSKHFGAEVVAFNLGDTNGEEPLLLLADHLTSPKCELIYEVEDLESTAKDLRNRGWKHEGEMFEIPNGPCYLFKDPSGNTLVIFQNTRPSVVPGSRPS
jgi:predicted enzyme related to lactoylglutathione lyase